MSMTEEQKSHRSKQLFLQDIREGKHDQSVHGVSVTTLADHRARWEVEGIQAAGPKEFAQFVSDAHTKLNVPPDFIACAGIALMMKRWGYSDDGRLEQPPEEVLREVEAIGRWAKQHGIPFD